MWCMNPLAFGCSGITSSLNDFRVVELCIVLSSARRCIAAQLHTLEGILVVGTSKTDGGTSLRVQS